MASFSPNLTKVYVLSILMLISLSSNHLAKAQVKLIKELKISDEVMFFDGTKNKNSTNKDVNAPYDFAYGNALTPHGDCIKAFKDFVFMTWYRGGKDDRHVMLTRYNMKTGIFKTIKFPHRHTGFNGKWWIGETHNTIGIGICPKDSSIHMLYDQHRNANVAEFVKNNDVLRYSYSENGAATVPDEMFTIERFVNSSAGNYKHQSFNGISGGNSDRITSMLTYPAFFTNDDGDLFLKNRFGYSANGKFVFAYYDGNKWNGYYDFNYTEAQKRGSEYTWGLYGDIKYLNGKIRIGFQRRSGNRNDKYKYQNGVYYAYSDDPKGVKDWKDHKGADFNIPLGNADRIKITEPGDWVKTTEKNTVNIVGGFNYAVTDNEDIHCVSMVKDLENNVTKKLHTYKPKGANEFTTVEYNAGSELYSFGNDVFVIGLKNGKVNIAKTEGGKSNFKQVYQHSTGPSFDKGVVFVYSGKLYYYLKQAGNSGDKRTTYLQIFDLGTQISGNRDTHSDNF